jgi:hypothetical protein
MPLVPADTPPTTATGPIDVYADVVPGPRQRGSGQRRVPTPAPTGALEHGYRQPAVVAVLIERPTVWEQTAADRGAVLARLDAFVADDTATPAKRKRERRHGLVTMLDWLTSFDGDSWQQRWIASGLNEHGSRWTDQIDPGVELTGHGRATLIAGAGALLALDVVRPSYRWLFGFLSHPTLAEVQAVRDRAGFARLAELGATLPGWSVDDQVPAFKHLTRILLHNGGTLADITVADCREAFSAQLAFGVTKRTLWYWLLLNADILGDDAPRDAHSLMKAGQRTVTQLVDGYRVESPAVRELLIDYLHERQAVLDYTSLAALASKLVLLFWRDLEFHHPGIDTLHLDDDIARGWKDRLRVVVHGKQRVGQRREDPNAILIAVRAFYTDINHWANEDPARWGRWAAPNPITGRDLIGQNKQKHRARARMQQRTRDLAPLITAIAASAEQQRRHAADLLTAARQAGHGDTFTVNDETLTRLIPPADPARGGRGRAGMMWAETADGRRRNLGFEEERIFWGWAIIEALRHTGIRIEELTELTHRSFVAYTLPGSGEIIPLLQVTPSKTDRERLLVVSPELGETLTTIIHRISDADGRVPLLRRYDHAERVHSPPLPFLFQRRQGLVNTMITPSQAGVLINRIMTTSSIVHTDGTPARITPHDFRRIYATEAVSAGLPVHIAAKVLGHANLNTTQGYVAVYDHDVIEHHRAFIARRRQQRPSHEYRDVTDTEWDEFLDHFEHRKVELGTCGRAYATPCHHEHACIRCPLLRVDPRQVPRLEEICVSLTGRLREAHQRGWAGEIDGLNISLAAARRKLEHAQKSTWQTS